MMEMITLYLEQTPPLIEAMRDAATQEDWTTLQAIAHKLIPSFSIVGIHTDYENMTRNILEYANSKKRFAEIPALVHQLETVCTQACLELEEELQILKALKS